MATHLLRFYVRSAGSGTNSYNVYDRAAYHPSNITGHCCVDVMLTREEADHCANTLNAEEARADIARAEGRGA